MSQHLSSSREAWIRALVTRVTLARGYKSALGGVLKRLCRSGGWSYAEAWIPTHDGLGLKMGPVFARSRADEVSRFRQRGREMGFRPGQGLVGNVFLSAIPRWVASLSAGGNEIPRRQALAREAGFHSAAAFPVLVNDQAVAVLVFYGDEIREHDATLSDKAGVALAAVGPALEQKRVEMSVRAQARQHEVVANIGLRALDKSADMRSLLSEAVELAANTLDADAAAVLELHDDGRLTVRASAGWPGEAGESTIAEPYFAHVLAAGRPVAVPSFRGENGGFPPPSLFTALAARSAATAVVPGRTRPLGLLCVVARDARRFPEEAFLRGLAHVLGVAMERDRAERDLEKERARLLSELEASHEKLRQAERLRAIATLASGITHDMNNVMLPALCRLDAIEAAGLPASAAREIEGVRGAFDKLRKLARGLQLVATNPEDGVSFPASTRLEPWWREIGGLLALALRRDVQLTATFPDGLPQVAVAPPQLTHAVLGLIHVLGEAFDGPGRILVRGEADGPRFVTVSVADASPEPRARAADALEKRTTAVRGFATAAGGTLQILPSEVVMRLPAASSAEPRPPLPVLPRRAEIQLKDARAAAFVTSLLASAGFQVSRKREGSVLAVWDGTEDPAAVRRYLSENSSRRVLLLGAPGSPAPRGASVVNEPHNLEAVRRTLGTMVEELLEITDDSIRTDPGPVR